ncbi:MAG: exodeoxyribonuclease VII small subunit [Clostridia bacterium]|nr:exodeoxyribonuclease VII small subunit [Clostridia bacterium]
MEEKLNFEETMKELEEIVQELEKGELNLDDSIQKFEKGMELSKSASKYLEDAEKKITILVKDKEGNLEEQDF